MPDSRSYFARYLDGDRVAVWDELIALGNRVREQELFQDATAVAEETVRRAKHNLELIHTRLVGLGYQFAHPDEAFVSTRELLIQSTQEEISDIERRVGNFPLLLKAWYQSVESLDFSQTWVQMRPPSGPDVQGLGRMTTLHMKSLRHCWREHLYLKDYAEQHHLRNGTLSERFSFLPTGGNASNCEHRGVDLPSLGADAMLYNEGGGDIYLVTHLRRNFEWGGFPGCKYYAKNPDASLEPLYAKPNWGKVIPLLREGLLEI